MSFRTTRGSPELDGTRRSPLIGSATSGSSFPALDAAIHDLGSEIRACLLAADRNLDQTYALEANLVGHRKVGTLVETVTVRKIVAIGLGQQQPLPQNTPAETCIVPLLLLELPPDTGPSSLHALIRPRDLCARAPTP